jgi:serine protease Do
MKKTLIAFALLAALAIGGIAQERAETRVRHAEIPAQPLHKELEAHRIQVGAAIAAHTVSVEIDYDRDAVAASMPSRPPVRLPIPGMPDPADPFSRYDLGPFSGLVVGPNHILISDRCLGAFNEAGAGPEVEAITVTLPNGERWPARVIGRHQQIDLALLELDCIINETCPELNVFELPSERAELTRGETILVVGRGQNPLGTLVNGGIVSALHREQGRAFQLDARIGNSTLGAPVARRDGTLVGIVTLHNHERFGQASGISYAAYMDEVNQAYQLLAQGQFIKRPPDPFLGVGVEKKWPDRPGLEVGNIVDGSAAQKAGLRTGDVLLKVNDRDMNEVDDLIMIINRHKVGDTLTLLILRGEEELTVSATLGARQ